MGATLVLNPDGALIEINLKQDVNEHLLPMYEHIGCTAVTYVALTDRIGLWLDEDGPLTQRPNVLASRLGWQYGLVREQFYGPVLVCGIDGAGNSTDLTDFQQAAVLTHLVDFIDHPL
ncbi:DUF3846 domain-containing protein [Nocardia sp. NPDC051030]|uniref:DUF3846 domain-containing protein n=1 Tax=Nocardia sp. NPDC051030 TaxID=3155162 RepID=UPI00343C434F